MNTIWILVANQAEAQIYTINRIHGEPVLVSTLTHAEGSAHVRDLISDAPGRIYNRTGPARHGMESNTGVKEEERRRFVKELVERLESAYFKGKFDQLVLLVAPALLGVIRKYLSGELAKAVIKEISKDVIGQDISKIQAQLVRSFELR